jgi:hypothetical protein
MRVVRRETERPKRNSIPIKIKITGQNFHRDSQIDQGKKPKLFSKKIPPRTMRMIGVKLEVLRGCIANL